MKKVRLCSKNSWIIAETTQWFFWNSKIEKIRDVVVDAWSSQVTSERVRSESTEIIVNCSFDVWITTSSGVQLVNVKKSEDHSL